MVYDDIDLGNDKNAPKLDLDFGIGTNGASDKKSSGFSFGGTGGWGGGWGTTQGNSWGFNGIEDDSNKKSAVVEDTSWNFPAAGKKDKKKKTNGFDFDFDNFAGEDDLGLTKTETKEDKAAEEDPWYVNISPSNTLGYATMSNGHVRLQ